MIKGAQFGQTQGFIELISTASVFVFGGEMHSAEPFWHHKTYPQFKGH